MGKLVCLMGKSSSGKDTIYKRLRTELPDLLPVVLYTTRPMREGEQDGVEYHFVSEEEYQSIHKSGRIMEERSYQTVYGVWRYFTVWDEEKNLNESSYIMIGTPEAFEKIVEYLGREQVVPVFIDLDDGVRLQRALDREKAQDHPRYLEMCRRFLADAEDFSREKTEALGIEKVFYNDHLEQCLEEIKEYIRQQV